MRESSVTSTTVKLLDVYLFWRILVDPITAFDRKKTDKSLTETYSENHFLEAQEERHLKDQLVAENEAEISRNRSLCLAERKKWEEAINVRYSEWMQEEYNRLKAENRNS